MTRKLKKYEKDWISRMERLLNKMPRKLALFADGKLKVVDAKEDENYDKIKHFLPLYTFDVYCGGGDPWK